MDNAKLIEIGQQKIREVVTTFGAIIEIPVPSDTQIKDIASYFRVSVAEAQHLWVETLKENLRSELEKLEGEFPTSSKLEVQPDTERLGKDIVVLGLSTRCLN